MVSEGLITMQDIEDAKSNKGNGKAICTGLAAYGILQSLLRSAKYNSPGILLGKQTRDLLNFHKLISMVSVMQHDVYLI